MRVEFRKPPSSIESQLSTLYPTDHPCFLRGPSGKKEVDALIDTGASYCIISSKDAFHLGYKLASAPSVQIATAGGIVSTPLITLYFIEVLGLRRQKVKTLVKDLPGGGIQTILGWSFLDHFNLKIDLKRKRLELSR